LKKLPDLDLQLHNLFDIVNGRTKTQLLLSAIELNIFDHLKDMQSAESVAAELNTHPVYTRFLLDGLAALDLVDKEDGGYRNRPDTQVAFDRQSPAYVGEMFTMMDQMSSPVMKHISQRVRSGPPDEPADFGNEAIWAAHARSMANYQRGGAAQKMAARVAQIDGFQSFEKMLDLGGGPGLYCIAMVGEHPSMQGVIFDRPAVTKVAEEFIAEYEMADRVSTMGGDYVNDSIGEGYDLIWASATLNFACDRLDAMIEKIHHALKPGGVFVSHADGLTHERTRPAAHVLVSMAWMLSGQDIMFNSGEVAEAIKRAGFSSVESSVVESPMVPMELDIARK
jgi:predicted O-methyltransferase YrrM